MNRVAVLADVHGNLPALRAVLADVERERFDLVVSAGDVVSGPMPAACLHALAALGDRVRWVRGNADRLALAAAADDAPGDADPADRFAGERLDAAERALVRSFAPRWRRGELLVCHGTPDSDEGVVTLRSPPARVAALLSAAGARLVVGGHVHHQFVHRCGARAWVNAGSVGMPYEGCPGAYWAAVEPDGSVELRRSAYDLEGALAEIDDTGYPGAAELAGVLRGEVGPDEAAAAFEPGA